MRLDHLGARHFPSFPEDVQAILNLFPDEYVLKSDPDRAAVGGTSWYRPPEDSQPT